MSALERAREDIEAGRLWKARDRLQGALGQDHADQDSLELLGDVCFAMGDLPAAGRYWFLTEKAGQEVDTAHAALLEQAGRNAQKLLVEIPARAPLERYPKSVQARLEDLITQARRAGYDWHPKVQRVSSPSDGNGLLTLIVLFVAAGALAVWFLGFAYLIKLLIALI